MEFNEHFDLLNTLNQGDDCKQKCCENVNNFISLDEIIHCKICDKIISNIIDSPEWRFYGHNDNKNINPTRCGMPVNILLPDSSLGSSVSNTNRNNNNMNKISTYQKWNSMPYRERSLYKVFTDIQVKCTSNNLPEIIISTSKSLYKNISENKISRGANRIGVIASCIYYACKECNVPRSINELSTMFDISPKIMTKGCKIYNEIMRTNKNKMRKLGYKSINLNDFIERFSHQLKLSEKDIENIFLISKKCEELKIINDNTPPSMAAGCIYLYIKKNKINIYKNQISEVCKISEVTINKCYKKLESNEDILKLIS